MLPATPTLPNFLTLCTSTHTHTHTRLAIPFDCFGASAYQREKIETHAYALEIPERKKLGDKGPKAWGATRKTHTCVYACVCVSIVSPEGLGGH